MISTRCMCGSFGANASRPVEKKVIFVTRIHEQYVVGAFRWVIILMGKKFSNYEIIRPMYNIVETIDKSLTIPWISSQ